MRNQKQKNCWVHLEMFRTDIVVIICAKENLITEADRMIEEPHCEELKRMIKEKQIENEEGINFPVGEGGGSVIWLPQWKIGVFVHEAVHAMINVMLKKGMTISKDSEEVLSYGVEFLLDETLRKLKV